MITTSTINRSTSTSSTSRTARSTGSTRTTVLAVLAALVLTAPLAHAAPSGATTSSGASGTSGTGSASVPTQTIDGITFPASFPAATLNTLKVSTPASFDVERPVRPIPRNTTNITPDLYVPGKIRGVNGEPPLAHCRNLVAGGRQCVTPAPEGGW